MASAFKLRDKIKQARSPSAHRIVRDQLPANAIILEPVVVVLPDGAITVVDRDTGRQIMFAGMEAAVWAFMSPDGGQTNKLRCDLQNVPVTKAQPSPV